MAVKSLSIEGVAKRFPVRGGKIVLFENLWLSVPRGEVTCVIGHPGCGKTTLVKILAGLEAASDGVVILDGHEIEGPSLERAVLFPDPALLPWRTVLGNVGYAVRAKWPGWSTTRAVSHTRRFIDLAGLAGMEMARPCDLNAGMKQRVAMARALSVEPKILLMDEPFSALDALTRATLHDDLRLICRSIGQTAFMVTHDVDEAVMLADRIVLMSDGPKAVLAEAMENPLPKERTRASIHRHPRYYAARNHIIDFLASRSASVAEETKAQPRNPREIPLAQPILLEPAIAESDSWPGLPRSAAIATIEATTRSVEEARRMPGLRTLLRKARTEFGE
jgi:nitrate/nitrite transport system ATP-binding protein